MPAAGLATVEGGERMVERVGGAAPAVGWKRRTLVAAVVDALPVESGKIDILPFSLDRNEATGDGTGLGLSSLWCVA